MKRSWIVLCLLAMAACGGGSQALSTAPRQSPTASPSIIAPAATPSSPATTARPKSKPVNQVLVAQNRLNRLGYPAGPVDGKQGPLTEQGLCAFRAANGLKGARAKLNPVTFKAIKATSGLPTAAHLPRPSRQWLRGLVIDQTCQVMFYVKQGRISRVLPVSTGRPGYPTPNGHYQLGWRAAGWTESTEFPDGWMYDFQQFSSGKGVHGVSAGELLPYPASHGCVRMSVLNAKYFWGQLSPGDPLIIFGRY